MFAQWPFYGLLFPQNGLGAEEKMAGVGSATMTRVTHIHHTCVACRCPIRAVLMNNPEHTRWANGHTDAPAVHTRAQQFVWAFSSSSSASADRLPSPLTLLRSRPLFSFFNIYAARRAARSQDPPIGRPNKRTQIPTNNTTGATWSERNRAERNGRKK